MEEIEEKKKRRSKADSEGRNFTCDCGKRYFSYQALYTHKKTKHSDNSKEEAKGKLRKGRPSIDSPKRPTKNKVEITCANSEFLETNRGVELSLRTCDDAFREYLFKMRKKVDGMQFAILKCSMNSLRECINNYSEKLDSNYFFNEKDYTKSESPFYIPKISNFYILDYLPSVYPGHSKTDEIHFILEFCKWLYKKQYTDLEVSISVPLR